MPPSLPSAPFTDWLGTELVSTSPGRVVLRQPQRPELANRRGAVHGGVLATLVDSAMARAARAVEGVAELGGTIDLHLHFMAPGTTALQVTGWVEHASRNLAFCRAEVHDEAGALVATGTASLRLYREAGAQAVPIIS